MLAARGAWAVLRKEHAQIRRLLDSIAESLHGAQWRQHGAALGQLRGRIEALQAFDRSHHRPKGVALMGSLRGRSAEADRLVTQIEAEREHDDEMLDKALAMLDAVAVGEQSVCPDIEALLTQHHERMLHQLEQEETLLCEKSEQLLTADEWSHVVSAISSSLYPRKKTPDRESEAPPE
jgi:hypothetical protein